MGRPAQESSTAGNCRKSPSSRNFTSAFSPTQARSAQSAMSSCVISSTTSQSSFCALPPRTCLRTHQAQVLRGAVCLGHQVHRLALLSQPRNNGPGQVRLSGARQAREQQGVARQAVAYRVVHPVPPPLFGPLRLHARRPAAQQRLRLFHAVDRRAVRVAQRLQRPQPLREALRQPLRQQAVRLHLRQVARRRVQDAPGLGHHAVLKAQHRVVDGAVGAVAQQPPRVDQRQTPSSSIAASETFGYQPGPTHGNRFRQDCLASQQPSTP